MSDVTRILSAIEQGDPSAAEQLLPLVYNELRKLAAANLAQEKPGQTLQATALVHDAFVRLVDVEQRQGWNSRGHFFAAAAEAMHRILVENARRKQRQKHGKGGLRQELADPPAPEAPEPNPKNPTKSRVFATSASLVDAVDGVKWPHLAGLPGTNRDRN